MAEPQGFQGPKYRKIIRFMAGRRGQGQSRSQSRWNWFYSKLGGMSWLARQDFPARIAKRHGNPAVRMEAVPRPLLADLRHRFSGIDPMLTRPCSHLAASLLMALAGSHLAVAQRTTTGTTTGTPEAVPSESLDPDSVFGDVQRGETIGATGETGQGFSDLSVSPATGGAGRGGIGGLGGGGLGGFGGGLGGLGGLFGGAFGGRGTAQSAQPIIRTRLRSAVAVAPTPPAQIQQTARSRFRTLPSRQAQLRGINVTMQGRTAVLSGTVNNARDRRMGEMLIRLEPGVSRVDNQIVVAP
jgi:hypothetical protein